MGGLAQGEVEPDFVGGHVEALAELGDVLRQQCGLAGRGERQADVGGADHLGGEGAERLADLGAEHGTAHGAHHAHQRAGHGLHLLGQDAAHGVADPLGDRVDEVLPDREGGLDPLGAAPGDGGAGAGGELGGAVEPQVGEPDGLGDGGVLGGADRAVLALALGGFGDDALAGDVLGEVPVHRAALEREHLPELLERAAEVVGVEAAEHRGERVVGPAGAARGSAAGHAEQRAERVAGAEAERLRAALVGACGALVLLLLLVVGLGLAVLGLLGRNAESEGKVAHGVLDPVGRHTGVAGSAARPGHQRSGGLVGGSSAAGPRRVHRRAFASGRMDVRDTRPYAHKLTVEDGR